MLKQLAALSAAILLAATMLVAHGDATHLMGTVTAIDAKTVTIKDKDSKSINVMLEKTTKYLENKKAATKDDVKVGARVVIDAKMDEKMKMYKAEEIHIGTAAADAKPAQKAAGKKEFTFRGKVEKIDPKTKMLTINGEKVEGWMNAMTMAYPVDKEDVLKQVKVGDRITAKVYEGDLVLHDVHVAPPAAEQKDGKSAPKK